VASAATPRGPLTLPWVAALLLATGEVRGAGGADAPPELASYVRAGSWQEVRAACQARPQPWPAEVALVAARAARHLGEPLQAQDIVRAALPRAGPLAAALRLEGAEAALGAARDPWPLLQPLVSGTSEAAHRRAAAALLRRAWDELPVRILARYETRSLPQGLRRWWEAIAATRQQNVALALKVLAQRHDDAPAGRVAPFLSSRPDLPGRDGLLVGRALLATGRWREASDWLAALSPPDEVEHRHQLAFLGGRAAYRLGRLTEAVPLFQKAIATASTAAQRHSAAVQLARCQELLGEWEMAQAAWELARQADPAAPVGWEGVARARIVRGEEDVCAALAEAPAAPREAAAQRVAALLLARSQGEAAGGCLRFARGAGGRARLLDVVHLRLSGHHHQAQQYLSALLADVSAGRWREVALLLPSTLTPEAPSAPTPTRLLPQLAELAAHHGPRAAQGALEAALARDPTWAAVVQGSPPEPDSLPPHLKALLAVGLARDAAQLYPSAFPAAHPAEAAWSARALAQWGNWGAALTAGERVWRALGGIPAGLLPPSVARAVLPPELLEPVVAAAAAAQVSPALLAAVIRQESRFDAQAFSPAGARGLAQLVPETARRLGASEEDLWRPEHALVLAGRELARLQQVFGNRPAVVAAAYNAGEGVVASWLTALGEDCDQVTFTAAIPYQETSGYVLAVLEGMGLARYLEAP